MTAAEKIYQAIGGGNVRETARVLGLSHTSVAKWNHSKDRGGCAGAIPHTHHAAIMKAAGELGVKLTTSDLVNL